jgi:hypothetical protein
MAPILQAEEPLYGRQARHDDFGQARMSAVIM